MGSTLYSIDKTALDQVQWFASRVITHKCHANHSTLLNSLNWQPLEIHRRLIKLKVCYNNILNNYYCIPSSVFTPHPYSGLHHFHNRMLLRPNAKTYSHIYSFIIDIVPIWNSLPADVIRSLTARSFKTKILALYS